MRDGPSSSNGFTNGGSLNNRSPRPADPRKESPVSTTANQNIEPCSGLERVARLAAENFANVLYRAYLDASDDVRHVIEAMTRIYADPKSDPQDRESAMDTLVDALFPQMHKGELGIDLHDVKVFPNEGPGPNEIESAMTAEEASFAERLATFMEQKGISQAQLAEMTDVGQSAIAMMLARDCRPQRRTVAKLAEALKVTPESLWPGFRP